ncbi:glycoside hydrolase family 28 protein [Uliginosibacterium gangwonense]|uniref:glycoside hydrolase family 28 protein n=1 Tax=Uliginosibacterium gangwonense TaxID=392736 RepID=UPI0012F9C1C9|nr:glycosyl hydrolase family 28 protein [Uliginosibacterium gangwonense]
MSDNKVQDHSDDTALLQASIDDCARRGGGRLELAGRTYQIGPIELRSKVYLVLAPDTVLQATADKTRFERAFIGWPFHAREALISAYKISDSGILGTGRIDGQGALWWEEARRQRRDGTMASMFPALPDANGMPRPWLVEFYDSRNITIDGPTLQNSPMWTLALRYASQVRIGHLTIRNPKEAPNTDGIDVVASQNVSIHNVDIATGDDNITIKSGLAGFGVPTQAASDIHVTDAKFGSGHGFSIGSETLNGVNHVTLERVSFEGTTNGIRIKTGRDRGADISAIHVKDITMNNVDTALSITAYYPKFPAQRGEPLAVTATTPRVHDIRIEGLVAIGSNTAGIFVGLPESPLRDVVLSKVRIQAAKGLMLRDAEVQADRLDLQIQNGKALDQQEEGKLNKL